ncbi:MAG TPA: hypothetical protein VFJ97_08265 [Dermatophilaceae bacterium]|nr:hypothetical protein [Dermatophilaceae bacterium]
MTGFFFPAVPLARVAWLRRAVYPFVVFDMLFVVRDPVPHGDVPAALYRPLLVRQWLHLPQPSPGYVRALAVLLVVSAVVAATGRLPRLAGWVCAFAMLDWVSNGFSYAKIDHDHFALMVALFVLPSVGHARVGDLTANRAAGWAVRMTQLGAVAIYFLSFWAKVRFGGWLWANGATLTWALTRRGQGLAAWLGGQPALTHALQWNVVVMEFASPLMLWLRGRPLYAYLGFWGVFHLCTYLLLTIHFLPLVVCLLAFLPLERLSLLRRPARPRPAEPARPPAASAAPSSAR